MIQNSPGNSFPTTKNRTPGATLVDDASLCIKLNKVCQKQGSTYIYIEVLGLYQTEGVQSGGTGSNRRECFKVDGE